MPDEEDVPVSHRGYLVAIAHRRNTTRSVFFVLVLLALGALDAQAQGDDAAYCAKLSDYARRYLGDAGGDGGTRPSFDVIQATDDCSRGNTAAGIAALEKKIRGKGFTPPAR